MDTLLILQDSISAHVVKLIDTCQPCVQEAETNLKIVGIICLAIVLAVLIVSVALCLWQKAKCKFAIDVDEQKFKHEIEKAKLEAEIRNNEKTLLSGEIRP